MVDEFAGIASRGSTGPAILALQACKASETAWFKAQPSGLTYFARLMAEAYGNRNADTNHDGWISVQEAFSHAAPRVHQEVQQTNGKTQTPQIHDSVGEDVRVIRLE